MLMVCIKSTRLRVYIHAAWASVLFVRIRRQCESLDERNSNSAVPLLFLESKAEHYNRSRFFVYVYDL